MHSAAFYGAAHGAVAAVYLVVAWRCWANLRGGGGAQPDGAGRLLLPMAVLGHFALLAQDLYADGALRVGFAQALSASAAVACALLWVEGKVVPLGGLYALMAPFAAFAALLPLVFHGAALSGTGNAPALRFHLGVSVAAYSLFSIAALHSALMMSIARYLRRPAREASPAVLALLAQMPSLLALESWLFRQLTAGFLLLTASLGSGIFFSEELFGRPLRLDHKTVFALLAWAVFGGLLLGRYVFGWRGRVAQRWLFFGFLMLVLAYIGSRFVFEVVLERAWF